MANHAVKFTVPERELGRADVVFGVKVDGEHLGRLKVSNGAVVWVPANGKYGYRISWSEFAAIMKERGKHEKK